MNEALPGGMRIEIGEPVLTDASGGPRWTCFAKLKGRRTKIYEGLPWIGGSLPAPPPEITETLFATSGNGNDPAEAIRDAKAKLVRYSSAPPRMVAQPQMEAPLQAPTLPPTATTRTKWWLARIWRCLGGSKD